MAETSLAGEMEKHLPAELVSFLQSAGTVAAGQGQNLYLVGGVVRDLLLGRTNLDLDLVVEGNAISLAQQLADTVQAKIVTHSRFGTAKIRWHKWSVDLATVRSETYERPGALPTVKPGSLESDLFRRDFTINAMALELAPGRYGRLIDLYGGRSDLEKKLLRILHEKSFIDDATRIWRAIRYEQRLDFNIEPETLRLLKRDIPMLDTISGDRIRHELELVLKEEFPEKALRRAGELSVLTRLQPRLKGNGWLAERFDRARQLSRPDPPTVAIYLALLAYPLTGKETEDLISYLRLPKSVAQTLQDTHSLKERLELLTRPRLKPSHIYQVLHGYSQPAITVLSLADDSSVVRKRVQLFLNKLRYIKPALTGDDLQRMGVAPGPQMKEILQRLLEARLDGKVTSRQREVELVRGWVTLNCRCE